jgi:hypothetical protein
LPGSAKISNHIGPLQRALDTLFAMSNEGVEPVSNRGESQPMPRDDCVSRSQQRDADEERRQEQHASASR